MSAYIIAPRALADLDDIWLYIAQDSISAADHVLDEIYAAIKEMAQMPGMGHTREDLTSRPLRFWPVYSYLIVYRAEADRIEIVRVLSGYRDIETMLS